MTPTVLFYALFAATLVLLLATVATGLKRQRRRHLPLVFATVVLLLATIWQAYRLGAIYDLSTAGAWTPVHMFLARAAAFSFLPTLAFGALTLRDGKRRRMHGLCAWTAFALTAAAALTGTVMLSKARPRAELGSAHSSMHGSARSTTRHSAAAAVDATAVASTASPARADVVSRDPR